MEKTIIEEWDYKAWVDIIKGEPDFFTQYDWNNTIPSTLNRIAIKSGVEQGGDVILQVPTKLWDLFNDLPFLGGMFNFELIHSKLDTSTAVKVNNNAVLVINNFDPYITDLDKFLRLYKSIGINLDLDVKSDKEKPQIVLKLEQGEHDKFGGYYGFCSEIVFDKNGKFIQQNFWE